ncbi:MAG: hypothetical protein COV67_00210 [Nitrospinae bacterium CG11_big_fil_rev_8_21_14_0_20_56_8]|nr:MAG: hypothetical protein COV67_00210 [Nitrospinae bacterium CG11_big_fil_rev_8_21_14_0_20_56_8]
MLTLQIVSFADLKLKGSPLITGNDAWPLNSPKTVRRFPPDGFLSLWALSNPGIFRSTNNGARKQGLAPRPEGNPFSDLS